MTVAVSTSITSDISALVGVVRTPSVLVCMMKRVKRVSSLQRVEITVRRHYAFMRAGCVSRSVMCGNAFMLDVNSRGGNENVIFGRHTPTIQHTYQYDGGEFSITTRTKPMNTSSDLTQKKFPHIHPTWYIMTTNFPIKNFQRLTEGYLNVCFRFD